MQLNPLLSHAVESLIIPCYQPMLSNPLLSHVINPCCWIPYYPNAFNPCCRIPCYPMLSTHAVESLIIPCYQPMLLNPLLSHDINPCCWIPYYPKLSTHAVESLVIPCYQPMLLNPLLSLVINPCCWIPCYPMLSAHAVECRIPCYLMLSTHAVESLAIPCYQPMLLNPLLSHVINPCCWIPCYHHAIIPFYHPKSSSQCYHPVLSYNVITTRCHPKLSLIISGDITCHFYCPLKTWVSPKINQTYCTKRITVLYMAHIVLNSLVEITCLFW
jgi:hypothetical protein